MAVLFFNNWRTTFGGLFYSFYKSRLLTFFTHSENSPIVRLFQPFKTKKMVANRAILLLVILNLFLVGIYAQGVCTHQGMHYRNGDEWTYRSFVMRCDVYNNYWQTKVVACLSLMGDRIPVSGQIRDRHGVWKCIQDPSGSTRLVQE